MVNSGVCGLVLTGGRSSRMGTDKALIELDGVTLGRRVVDTVARVASPVLVVGPHGDLGAEAFPDDGLGPLVAFATGWKHLRTLGCEGPVILAAGDLPFLAPELLAQLVGELEGHEAVVPMVDGRRQPLAGCYAPEAYRTLLDAVERGATSMNALLDALNVRYLEAGEWRESLFDIDSPDDLEAIRRPASR